MGYGSRAQHAGDQALDDVGGAGAAAFASMQVALMVLQVPPVIEAQLMGLLTVCIGRGPLGILLASTLANIVGALHVLDMTDLTGLAAVVVAGIVRQQNAAQAMLLTLRAVMEEPR